MIESPILQKFVAGRLHEVILDILKVRFGTIPRDVRKQLRGVLDERKLRKFNVLAATCADLQEFQDKLPPTK